MQLGCVEDGLDQAEILRSRAAAERLQAAKCTLQNRRVMHERAAEAWDSMAQQLEETATRAAVNEAAKAAQ